ncbi:MFS transporter [Kineococcus gypseus]|uniref:MFS transporter n=1 Tax=Kineococcus gypseus TaxID=1637102 RepID=UPI003D7C56E3
MPSTPPRSGSDPSTAPAADTGAGPVTYRALLSEREFAGLYAGFTLTTAASTLSGYALGTLVQTRTSSPLLTALSMYAGILATVVGALTLMSIADTDRPRRVLLALQGISLAAVAAQGVPDLPLPARFALLLLTGFFASLGTGARLGLLSEVVPAQRYALARSLMNITSGAAAVIGFTLAAFLLRVLTPGQVFLLCAALVGAALVVTALSVREHSVRLTRRPGLARTWATNAALMRRGDQRVLLINLWVPNGLIVGCEALFLSYDSTHAGLLLAAGAGGMLAGDLIVGRFLTAGQRARAALGLRVLLAAPFLLFAVHPPLAVSLAAVFCASVGYAATLPLHEKLLAVTAEEVRGQVQGVESAGRMTWQGVGAVIAGVLAQGLGPAAAITAVAGLSLLITVGTAGRVRRLGSGNVQATN